LLLVFVTQEKNPNNYFYWQKLLFILKAGGKKLNKIIIL